MSKATSAIRVSLYRSHKRIINKLAIERGVKGYSPNIQFIIEDWWRLRGFRNLLSSQFGSQAPYEDSQSQAPGDDELFGPADIKAMKSQAKSQAPC